MIYLCEKGRRGSHPDKKEHPDTSTLFLLKSIIVIENSDDETYNRVDKFFIFIFLFHINRVF
jgi:uncharacterized protein YlzI (FlbEa/FlbD family)